MMRTGWGRERESWRDKGRKGDFMPLQSLARFCLGKTEWMGYRVAWHGCAVRCVVHNTTCVRYVCVSKSNALLLAEKNILSPSLYGRANFFPLKMGPEPVKMLLTAIYHPARRREAERDDLGSISSPAMVQPF